MDAREDSHAGSWYSDDKSTLSYQLDHWLQEVPDEIEGIGQLPVPGARMIIAPYVSKRAICILLPCPNFFSGTQAMHTPDDVPLSPIRPWTCHKRE